VVVVKGIGKKKKEKKCANMIFLNDLVWTNEKKNKITVQQVKNASTALVGKPKKRGGKEGWKTGGGKEEAKAEGRLGSLGES